MMMMHPQYQQPMYPQPGMYVQGQPPMMMVPQQQPMMAMMPQQQIPPAPVQVQPQPVPQMMPNGDNNSIVKTLLAPPQPQPTVVEAQPVVPPVSTTPQPPVQAPAPAQSTMDTS